MPEANSSDITLNKGQKLVRMLELLRRPGGVRAQTLMDRFGIDARTLRRYIADLRELGIPVRGDGESDRILQVETSYARTGVQLTLAEVLSLHFGRTLFTFLEGTSFASDMEGALERLAPAISRHAAEITDLDRKFMAVAEHAKNYVDEGELLDEIVSALLYCNPADAEYRPVRGMSRFYRLEPLTLTTYRQGLYLFARDVAEDKIKTFAVERFLGFSRLRREHFPYPADYKPTRLLDSAFGITSGQPEEVIAVFEPAATPFIRERTWHHSQVTEELPDGRLRLRLYVGVSPELKEWLLGLGANVRVEAPPALVSWVRDAHRAAMERYA